MRSLLGLIFGICISLILASFAGESPALVAKVLFTSAFGSGYDIGLALFYATSMIFTGLSVCVAFHAGLFNIGAEGQLNVAALACAVTALMFPSLPFPVSVLFAGFAGVLVGALWGFIPGWLRAVKESHEVIITMMLNFVAAGLTSYFVLHHFKNPDSQNPETAPIGDNFLFKAYDFINALSPDSPVNVSFLFAIVLCVFVFIFLYKTKWGFELRASGHNPLAAEFAGINSRRYIILAMSLAGAFAGCVGFNEILGSAGKFKIGFSPEYGFIGIAVSLLARNNPLAIIPAAFLFGVLQKGAADLDLETQFITRDFAKVIQAIVILSVIGFNFVPDFLNKWDLGRFKKKGEKNAS